MTKSKKNNPLLKNWTCSAHEAIVLSSWHYRRGVICDQLGWDRKNADRVYKKPAALVMAMIKEDMPHIEDIEYPIQIYDRVWQWSLYKVHKKVIQTIPLPSYHWAFCNNAATKIQTAYRRHKHGYEHHPIFKYKTGRLIAAV